MKDFDIDAAHRDPGKALNQAILSNKTDQFLQLLEIDEIQKYIKNNVLNLFKIAIKHHAYKIIVHMIEIPFVYSLLVSAARQDPFSLLNQLILGDNLALYKHIIKVNGIQEYINDNPLYLLGIAISQYSDEIIARMLEIPIIRSKYLEAARNVPSTILNQAIEAGKMGLFEFLIKIEEVQEYINKYPLRLLRIAANQKNSDIILARLLSIPSIYSNFIEEARRDPNKALNQAFMDNNRILFEYLIKTPEIEKYIKDNALSLLRMAISQNSHNIIAAMLHTPYVISALKEENSTTSSHTNPDGSYGYVARFRDIPARASFITELNYQLFEILAIYDHPNALEMLLTIPEIYDKEGDYTYNILQSSINARDIKNVETLSSILAVDKLSPAKSESLFLNALRRGEINIILNLATELPLQNINPLNKIRAMIETPSVLNILKNYTPLETLEFIARVQVFLDKYAPPPKIGSYSDETRHFKEISITPEMHLQIAAIRRLWSETNMAYRKEGRSLQSPILPIWDPYNIERMNRFMRGEQLINSLAPQSSASSSSSLQDDPPSAPRPQGARSSGYLNFMFNWCRSLYLEDSPLKDDPPGPSSSSSKRPRRR